MGNKKEQIKAAQRATEIDDSYEAWLHLANAYVESRMAEEAFATLRRLYAMNPRDADVLNNLGLISIMVHKDKVSAARYAEELQSVDPVRAAELLSLIRR